MRKIKEILLGIFFFTWERYLYTMLEQKTVETDTPLDDVALEAVDTAIGILKKEWEDG